MKSKKIFLISICTIFFAFGSKSNAQCKAKQIAGACKDNMRKPYKYDSYALNEFTFDDKEKQVEVQFTAFQGQKYKIVFCSSGFASSKISLSSNGDASAIAYSISNLFVV